MSPRAQIPSHRKPRSSKMNTALRAGVTGGVMGTIALTTAAAPSSASGKQATAETAEMPTISSDLAASSGSAAESMENSALRYQIQDAQDSAAQEAQEKAKETKEKAEAKARAEEKAEKAREEARAAQARADRGTERTDLGGGEASSPVEDAPVTGGGNTAGMVDFLKAQVGKSYVMGSTGPSSYDCSGLTGAAYKQMGVDLPRTSQEQSTAGTSVSLDSLQVGDLVYWGNAGEAYHIGVYIGDGKFIGAQNSSTGVVERDLDYDQPTGAVRVL